jgi:hypothetical protein
MLALYIRYDAYSCMTSERGSKEKLTGKDKSLLINAAYVIVHFLTEQNLSNTRTTCTGISNRFDLYCTTL